jgi:hypothetical protein
MRRAAREEVSRLIRQEPGKLRKATSTTVLALLAASALTPVAVEVAGGGALVSALAGVAGNIGSGYLTDIVERTAIRIRRSKPDAARARELLTEEFENALRQNNVAAERLSSDLAALVNQVGGWEEAADDLRRHLLTCFEELQAQHRTIRGVAAGQRQHTRYLEEIVGRLRLLMRDRDQPTVRADVPLAIAPIPVPEQNTHHVRWRGGAEITVGDDVYLLHERLLEERPLRHDAGMYRQALARRLIAMSGGERYVWLRQIQTHRETPETRDALAPLPREHDLLTRLREPRISRFAVGGRVATLAIHWPMSKVNKRPAETLDPAVSYEPFQLFGGIANLSDQLHRLHRLRATHRHLTPERLVLHDDGRLSLLDLGLAGHEYAPGEGPPDYQAPEQRRRGAARPGPYTDVYQLAAVLYRLLAGFPPHAANPLPLRSQVPDTPEAVGQVVDTALNAEPTARPTMRTFGAALRSARDHL